MQRETGRQGPTQRVDDLRRVEHLHTRPEAGQRGHRRPDGQGLDLDHRRVLPDHAGPAAADRGEQDQRLGRPTVGHREPHREARRPHEPRPQLGPERPQVEVGGSRARVRQHLGRLDAVDAVG